MPYSRQRPRVAATGRITVRLSPEQRDLFTHAALVPHSVRHELRHAPVRRGELSVRVSRETLDALIDAAAASKSADPRAERRLVTLLRYLESLAGRFEEPAGVEGSTVEAEPSIGQHDFEPR
jgi:uncharacterized protein (DUF1778 family)